MKINECLLQRGKCLLKEAVLQIVVFAGWQVNIQLQYIICLLLIEKPRRGLLHPNPVLGARSPNADPLRDPQYGAAAALLQLAQPGVQQQGQQPLRPRLRSQPHRCLFPQPQGGPQTGEPESVLESSSTKH